MVESDWNAHGYMDSGMSMKWVYTEYVVLTCTVMKSSPRCTLCRMLGIKCYHGKKKVHLNMFINTWTIFGMVNMKGITGYPQLQRTELGVYRGDYTVSILYLFHFYHGYILFIWKAI